MLEILHRHLGDDPQKLTHHSYLLSGPSFPIHTALKQVLHNVWGIPVTQPPIVFEYIHDTFGIDESRHLHSFASRKGFGEKQFFIIRAHTLTHQAQNALLKLFEEPSESVCFFLIVPNGDTLLPTLRSRFEHISLAPSGQRTEEGNLFLSSTIAERLGHIVNILKEKDIESARELVATLAHAVHTTTAKEAICRAERYLNGPSPSLKQVLEGLTYSLPRLQKKQ